MSEEENKKKKTKAIKEAIKKSKDSYVGLSKEAQKGLNKAFEIPPVKPPKKKDNNSDK